MANGHQVLPDHGPPDYETKGGKAETMKSETLKPESGYVGTTGLLNTQPRGRKAESGMRKWVRYWLRP